MQIILTRRALLSSIATCVAVFGATTAMAADPEKIGTQVYRIYVDTMVKTNAVLAGSPEPTEELGAQLDAIKGGLGDRTGCIGQGYRGDG